MPPLPAQPSVLAVELKHTYSNDIDVQVKQFWQYSGTAPTNAQLSAFCTAQASNWDNQWVHVCHSDVVLTEIVATDLTSATAARGSWSGSLAGDLSGAVLGAQVCFLVGYTIARRYRGGKPRNYWPLGDAATLQDPQHWTSAFVASVSGYSAGWNTQTALNGWTGGGTLSQVNVSYYEGFKVVDGSTGRAHNVSLVRGGPPPAGPVIAPDPITGYTYSPLLATQRRRTTRKR